MYPRKRCGSSVLAVISVIRLSFYRFILPIRSIIAVISVISVISLTGALMVNTSSHESLGRAHLLVRLKVFLAVIVPLRWLPLPLMIPLNRENEVASMQSRDLTGFLHLA